MSTSEIECCFKQILNGVSYLHSQGVAHRDLKLENIYLDHKDHFKVGCLTRSALSAVHPDQIGDFGTATVFRLPWEREAIVQMSSGLCGTEPYIAPEQFLGECTWNIFEPFLSWSDRWLLQRTMLA